MRRDLREGVRNEVTQISRRRAFGQREQKVQKGPEAEACPLNLRNRRKDDEVELQYKRREIAEESER